jgi:hypothetical protein
MATVLAHIQEPVPRPRRFNPDITPDLEGVILKSLAKKPEKRFPSIRALEEAYQAAVAGKPLPDFERMAEEPTTYIEPVPGDLPSTPGPESAPRRRRLLWLFSGLIPVTAAVTYLLLRVLGGGTSTLPPPSAGESPQTAIETEAIVEPRKATNPPAASLTPPPLPITADTCPGVALYHPTVNGDEVTWLIDNNSGRNLHLEDIQPGWPLLTNGKLEHIRLGQHVLWQGDAEGEGELSRVEGIDNTIRSGETTLITLTFQYAAGLRDYTLRLMLDEGCVLEGEW